MFRLSSHTLTWGLPTASWSCSSNDISAHFSFCTLRRRQRAIGELGYKIITHETQLLKSKSTTDFKTEFLVLSLYFDLFYMLDKICFEMVKSFEEKMLMLVFVLVSSDEFWLIRNCTFYVLDWVSYIYDNWEMLNVYIVLNQKLETKSKWIRKRTVNN